MTENKKPVWQRIGGEVIALVVLIPFIIVLSLLLGRFNNPTDTPVSTPTLTPNSKTTETPASSPTNAPQVSGSVTATQQVALEITAPGSTKNYTVTVTQEMSVIDLLRLAQKQGVTMETKDYGGSLGLFVESLNERKNDPSTGRYWNLYINGHHSPLGASNARVKPSDAVRWSLEKESNEQ